MEPDNITSDTQDMVKAAIERGGVPAYGGEYALGWIMGQVAMKKREGANNA